MAEKEKKTKVIKEIQRIKFTKDLLMALSEYSETPKETGDILKLKAEIVKSLKKHIGIENVDDEKLNKMISKLEKTKIKPSVLGDFNKFMKSMRNMQGDYFVNIGKKLQEGNLGILDGIAMIVQIAVAIPVVNLTSVTASILHNIIENTMDSIGAFLQPVAPLALFPKGSKVAVKVLLELNEEAKSLASPSKKKPEESQGISFKGGRGWRYAKHLEKKQQSHVGNLEESRNQGTHKTATRGKQ